mgnify:CR=1 FL=1
MDFGLAKLVKPRERTGTICGTLQYMGKKQTLNSFLVLATQKRVFWRSNFFWVESDSYASFLFLGFFLGGGGVTAKSMDQDENYLNKHFKNWLE